MNYLSTLTLILTLSFSLVHAGQPEDLFNAATLAYNEGDYNRSIVLFDSLHAIGYSSVASHYNLGNAHLQLNQLGPAVLNYERALKKKPGDKDVQANLELARTSMKERVAEVPDFFLKRWGKAVLRILSPTGWGICSLILLWIAAVAGVAFYKVEGSFMKKLTFWGGITAAVLALTFLLFAIGRQTEITQHPYGIVMVERMYVKNAPDSEAANVFLIYEGTKVRVEDRLGEWAMVRLGDRREGWIEVSEIEEI